MKIAIINCFDTYEHRVDLLVRYFINNGDSVSVFSSDFKHIEKVTREDAKEHFIFVKTKPYAKNLSLARLSSHYKLSRKIFKRIDESFDLIWILLPPNSLVNQAARYKQKNYQTKIVFDIIDLWPETMPVGSIKKKFPFTLWKNLRNKNLDKADYIVTECDLFKTMLPTIIPSNYVSTLYLSYGDVTRNRSLANLSKSNNIISLCYLGSMNNIIDINTIQ